MGRQYIALKDGQTSRLDLMKKLTIAIPVKNEESKIRKNIVSMIEAYKDIADFLVSDNASTDRSLEELKNLSQHYNEIKVFPQKYDLGAEENFKFLLTQSKTEYFMWIGGDDVISGDLLHAIHMLESDEEVGAVSFLSSFQSEEKKKKILDKSNFPILDRSSCNRMCKFLLNPGANSRFYSMYRRDALVNNINKFATNMLGADVFFSLSFLVRNKWGYCDKISLTRSYGISSNPIKLRERYGYVGLAKFLFFPRFLGLILKIVLLEKCLRGVLFLWLYWLRLNISPIKHYIDNKK